jgi:uncharacterized protein YndB with AHSA1/START domain
MKTILHAVHIHAAPSKVYDALTTAEGVAGWNWGYYLNSLKMLCEKGTGAPFNPPA